jgi:hypothetical protein
MTAPSGCCCLLACSSTRRRCVFEGSRLHVLAI